MKDVKRERTGPTRLTCISSDSTWQSVSAIDPKTVIRGVDVRAIEDTAVIEWLLARPERNVER